MLRDKCSGYIKYPIMCLTTMAVPCAHDGINVIEVNTETQAKEPLPMTCVAVQ